MTESFFTRTRPVVEGRVSEATRRVPSTSFLRPTSWTTVVPVQNSETVKKKKDRGWGRDRRRNGLWRKKNERSATKGPGVGVEPCLSLSLVVTFFDEFLGRTRRWVNCRPFVFRSPLSGPSESGRKQTKVGTGSAFMVFTLFLYCVLLSL